jgi:translocator protein
LAGISVYCHNKMARSTMSLIIFLILTVGGGLLTGLFARPGEWYANLVKPAFTPPKGVFAPVWTVLYIVIAIAGWRTFTRDPLGPAMVMWTIALGLNFSWSPIFFWLHQPVAALAVIVVLLAITIIFIQLTWPQDALSAFLFVPYAAWTSFAALLNAAICRLNTPIRDVR